MKLKNKIIALNVLALLLTLIISGPIVISMTDDSNLQSALDFLDGQSSYAVNYVEQYIANKSHSLYDIPKVLGTDSPYLCAVLEKTAKSRVQIFYGSVLLGDSSYSPDLNAYVRSEVATAVEGKTAYYIDTKSGERVLYYAVPLSIHGLDGYALAFTQSLNAQDTMRSNIIKVFAFTAILSAIFVVFISINISNKMTAPVDKLYQATMNFSKGELDARVKNGSIDEIGELSSAFDNMADSIQGMFGTIKDEQEKQKIFFDNFTHEIKTPLTTIIGYTDLLWKTDDENIKDKSLYYISSESKRMLKMIENLLALSRLKKFDFDVNKVNTDISKVVRTVCDSMTFKATRYNIAFNLDIYELYLPLDPDAFEQVIINLIDNAIKYSGTDTINIKLKEKGGYAILSISDNGCGMPKEDLLHAFEPYYKVDKTRSSTSDGYGLGLAIVKEIIEKHDGEITAVSVLGKGTTMNVKLRKG